MLLIFYLYALLWKLKIAFVTLAHFLSLSKMINVFYSPSSFSYLNVCLPTVLYFMQYLLCYHR